MSEEEKRILEQQLWSIANILRGKMNADEYRDYILGFIFYKYLSEKLENYANKLEEGFDYASIDENTEEGQEILPYVAEETINGIGYFLKPSELFSAIAQKGNANESETADNFILDDLQSILICLSAWHTQISLY